ncbi:MAG: choice-of-anchor B family protein [Ignavibacteriae bacterium]|nr:choice-of-anchor B family protein [Ignavibacteriota bacterium]
MKQVFGFLLALLACSTIAIAQPRLDTLRHIHPRPGTGLSAIWGYTAPDGREYALVGITGSGSGSTSGGTSIVDITNDASPRVVTHIVGPNSTWREMKTYRQYAYVVTEASSGTGVQIIDLSALPDTARLLRTFAYSNGAKNINKSHTITMSDGFMYLNGCANWSPGGALIFDLRNDPVNPQFVGEYQPQYLHDTYVLRDTIYGSAINSGGGLIIADARNKASVQTVGRIGYTGSGTHNAWLSRDRRYVMTTDEIGSTRKDLKVWDIGNLPAIPTATTASFTVDPTSTIHNVHVRGNYAYCAWYSGYGLQIADISNPALPALAAGYRTSSSSLAWETYPYFPSGKVIIGDGSTGLWIFRFSELASRRAVHLLAPADRDTVRSSSSMTLRWTRATDVQSDPHWYEIRLRGAGFDTTWRSADSVSLFTSVARLQSEQTYNWKVITRDEWNATTSADSFSFVYKPDGPTSVAETNPIVFGLDQNYPNPFNPMTTIGFRVQDLGYVSLKVFDLLGREVATLVDGIEDSGLKSVTFDASGLASGVYMYRLSWTPQGRAASVVDVKRMLVVR